MATESRRVFPEPHARLSFLARYRCGEEQQVWRELVAAGDDVRKEPLRSDALAVARDTMLRARENVQRLIGRLEILGYRFAYPRWSQSLVGYAALTNVVPEEILDDFEQRVGTLPLSLRAWFEIVGGVNLTGFHPDWHSAWSENPLVVNPLWAAFESFRSWRGLCERHGLHAAGPFQLPIAPASFDGGRPAAWKTYAVALPNSMADARIGGEPAGRFFVEYLRNAFRWGGFPQLERCFDRPSSQIALLSDGLQLI